MKMSKPNRRLRNGEQSPLVSLAIPWRLLGLCIGFELTLRTTPMGMNLKFPDRSNSRLHHGRTSKSKRGICSFRYGRFVTNKYFFPNYFLILTLGLLIDSERIYSIVTSTSIRFLYISRQDMYEKLFDRWNFEQVRERDDLGYQGRLYGQT